jgi:hypothetical protein
MGVDSWMEKKRGALSSISISRVCLSVAIGSIGTERGRGWWQRLERPAWLLAARAPCLTNLTSPHLTKPKQAKKPGNKKREIDSIHSLAAGLCLFAFYMYTCRSRHSTLGPHPPPPPNKTDHPIQRPKSINQSINRPCACLPLLLVLLLLPPRRPAPPPASPLPF